MDLFGIGPLEVVVIMAVALMLFSPKEIPALLRGVSRFWGQVRATADEFREAIMTADGVDEFQELVKGTKAEVRKAEDAARRELMKARMEMRKAQQKLTQATKANEEMKRKELKTEAAPVDDASRPVPTDPAAPRPQPVAVSSPSATAEAPGDVNPSRDVNQGAA